MGINIFDEIKAERERQEAKWGQQNWPILDSRFTGYGVPGRYGLPDEQEAKKRVEYGVETGGLTYMDILVEEVAEAANVQNTGADLRTELIQIAAVAVAMIQSLDRNGR